MRSRRSSATLLTMLLTASFLKAGVPDKDIVETVLEAGEFKTLMAAWEAAGLLEELKTEGPLTLLAPSDGAFERLPRGTLDSLLKAENRSDLRAILAYHVVPAKMSSAQATRVERVITMQGDDLRFWSHEGKAMVGYATVITADIPCSNGVIHKIDRVLLPPETPLKGLTAAH